MAGELYFWRGRKPHRHYKVTVGTTGKDKGRPLDEQEILIAPGDVFAPSAAELASFGDLMEPYGESLRVEEPHLVVTEG